MTQLLLFEVKTSEWSHLHGLENQLNVKPLTRGLREGVGVARKRIKRGVSRNLLLHLITVNKNLPSDKNRKSFLPGLLTQCMTATPLDRTSAQSFSYSPVNKVSSDSSQKLRLGRRAGRSRAGPDATPLQRGVSSIPIRALSLPPHEVVLLLGDARPAPLHAYPNIEIFLIPRGNDVLSSINTPVETYANRSCQIQEAGRLSFPEL